MKPLVEGKDYRLVNEILSIREGVKFIPPYSFEDNNNFKSLYLPWSLISIGEGAFQNCLKLTGELIIPDSVKYIHDKAFCNCRLHYLTIGKSVNFIGNFAFNFNIISSIKNLSMKLFYVGSRAFFQANDDKFSLRIYDSKLYVENEALIGLDKIRISNEKNIINVTDLKTASFDDPETYKIVSNTLVIANGIEQIGDFRNAHGIKRVEMADTVIMIRSNAFFNLSSLESIRFSSNLISIGDNAFQQTSLLENEVILPDSLAYLAADSFYRCTGPNKVSVPNHTQIKKYGDSDKLINAYFIRREDDNLLEKQKYIFDVNDLLEEDKKTLESVGLMTENNEKKYNRNIDLELSKIVKESLIKYIKHEKYDENKYILLVNNILMTREMDIIFDHEIINYLFEKRLVKTIYLFIKYGYNYFNNSMIARAILNNMNDMIKVLLLLGVHIDEIGTIEMTPLSIACKEGNISLVKYLIENGAALNKVDSNNKTAIDYAKENGHDEIVELLNDYNSNESEAQRDLNNITKLLKQ